MADGEESKLREKEGLEASLIRLLKKLKPESLETFVKQAEVKLRIPEKEIIDSILKLHADGKIRLEPQERPTLQNTYNYSRRKALKSYGITVAFLILTTAIVIEVPEDSYPLAVLRQIFGSMFMLWWPGFSFVKAFFPDSQRKSSSFWERVALSVCMSIAIVSVVALILNYTPWGVRVFPLVITLFLISMFFATVGVIRERKMPERVPA